MDFGDDSIILYTYNAKGEKLKTAYFINQMTPSVPQIGGGTGGNVTFGDQESFYGNE